ncbi:neutral/alkaline non-lysosomal ceramidase N-terminal domain-containing protein [Hoyosella rhizosphaerae]|uniref:Neutral ceramidase n=1 Tax=Hoyosella rhizosphaerae TaxID=1755582 RepID=A0A916TZP6_9ACTN|nr:neutral/alkaline non-lysosomal ceramidase N-terminal domain-containing protein [Hoyosella rhizosphaerae]MBN4927053.1 neutral/alkaline non-lysosomal ceramidase N-terminal domain-containing protein [Hoyosella rhizosphaerae]GGC54418.1 neutral ceramidase [Hoyosella rhizosphaerae]
MMGMKVGCGIADITGKAYGNGMMGYSMPQQRTSGIHLRLRARAFIVDDGHRRVGFVCADLGMIFHSVHQAVMARLRELFGDVYTEQNVLLTATHTHAGPGGFSHHLVYNLAPLGFHQHTFQAAVNGIVAAVSRAHSQMRPGTIALGHSELWDASVNRSRPAFDLNPAADKKHFPNAIDPTMTVLRFRQANSDVGAISFFATHGTSMTNTNRLISGDNKGYAAYHWEHDQAGVRYLDDSAPFVAAFPQTNAGDMSPNLNLRPGSGPADDEYANTQIIGLRQFASAFAAYETAASVGGGVDSWLRYADFSRITVDGCFTPDGKTRRTRSGAIGLPTLSGSVEDGPGIGLPEGLRKPYKAHDRRIVVLPSGRLGWTPNVLPLQLMRIGGLYLIAAPAEFTIVAGLRLRQTVATELKVSLDHVLLVGYSNAYSQYVTTPEEYDSQQYEGGSTLFGRYTLCAYQQEFSNLVRSRGHVPGQASSPSQPRPRRPRIVVRAPQLVRHRSGGQLVAEPQPRYSPGDTATAEFTATDPRTTMLENFCEIQQHREQGWVRIADDGDWDTKVTFHRRRRDLFVTLAWTIPNTVTAGKYRIVYLPDTNTLCPTPPFSIT